MPLPWLLLGGVGGYLSAFTLVRLSFSTSLNHDSAEQAAFSQLLAWGYDVGQPPLYTWLLIGTQHILGLVPASGIVLNYALCLLTVGLFFLCAQRSLRDPRDAALASLALLSMYPIGWIMHENLTHTMLLIACCAAALLAFCRLLDRGGIPGYVLFGAILGLGSLSKYSFLAFVLCLLMAAMMQPATRRVLMQPGMVTSLAVGLVLVSPYLLWLGLAGQDRDLAAFYRRNIAPPSDHGWAASMVGGLGSIPLALGAFVSPLLILAVIFIPALCRTQRTVDLPATDHPAADMVRLIRDMMAAGVVLLVIGVILGGIAGYKERWLHPLLMFAPIYLMHRVRLARPSPRQLRWFTAALIACPLVFLTLRSAQLLLGPPLCDSGCPDRAPFDQLARRLTEAGFTEGTILAGDVYIAGNLRLRFPSARVVWIEKSFLVPRPRATAGQCLMVWKDDGRRRDPPAPALRYAGLARDGPENDLPVRRAAIPWRLPFRHETDMVTVWAYLLVPGGSGRCA